MSMLSGCPEAHGRPIDGALADRYVDVRARDVSEPDVEPEVDAGPPPSPVESFLQELTLALCRGRMRCGFEYFDAFATAEQCASSHPHITERHPGLRPFWIVADALVPWNAAELVAEGRLSFDEGIAALCLERAASACYDADHGFGWNLAGPGGPESRPCAHVFAAVEPADVGGDCQYDFECGPGLSCANRSLPWGACAGRCTAQSPLGSICAGSYFCAFGGRGDHAGCAPAEIVAPTTGNVSGNVCSNVFRLPPAGEGETCGWMARDGDDVIARQCGDGLVCGCTSSACDPRCIRRPRSGEPCSPDGLLTCAAGASCVRGTCRTFDLTSDARTPGDPCWSTRYCDPTMRYACSESGQCVEWGDGGLGDLCWFEEAPCAPGLFCDPSEGPSTYVGVCERGYEVGALCSIHKTCATGCCDESGVCVEP